MARGSGGMSLFSSIARSTGFSLFALVSTCRPRLISVLGLTLRGTHPGGSHRARG